MKNTRIKWVLMTVAALLSASTICVYAAETKVEGVLFAGYSLYTSDYKTDNTLAYDYNTFDVARIYVTASTKYTPNITSKIVLEGATTTAGNAIFLKNAFLQWKDDAGGLTIEGGMPGTLWISPEEGVWKYRFVEKVQTDLEGVLHSADKGVKAIYKLPKGYGTAEGMLANGEGYKALETADWRKKGTKDGQLRLALTPFKNKDFSVAAHYLGSVGLGRVRERFVGGVAYQGKKFSLGASAFKSVDFSTVSATVAPSGKSGYSVYGNLPLNESVSLFGRFDWVDNSLLKSKNYDKKTLQFYGLAKELTKDVKVALVERIETRGQVAIETRHQYVTSLNLYAKF